MADWVLSRTAIIALAVVGGVSAGLAFLLQARGEANAARVRRQHQIAYVFMAASMVLFVVAGFSRGRS